MDWSPINWQALGNSYAFFSNCPANLSEYSALVSFFSGEAEAQRDQVICQSLENRTLVCSFSSHQTWSHWGGKVRKQILRLNSSTLPSPCWCRNRTQKDLHGVRTVSSIFKAPPPGHPVMASGWSQNRSGDWISAQRINGAQGLCSWARAYQNWSVGIKKGLWGVLGPMLFRHQVNGLQVIGSFLHKNLILMFIVFLWFYPPCSL